MLIINDKGEFVEPPDGEMERRRMLYSTGQLEHADEEKRVRAVAERKAEPFVGRSCEVCGSRIRKAFDGKHCSLACARIAARKHGRRASHGK